MTKHGEIPESIVSIESTGNIVAPATGCVPEGAAVPGRAAAQAVWAAQAA